MPFVFDPLFAKMKERGITKDRLRSELHMSWGTIARFKKGDNIQLSVLHKLCEYFDCQPNDIIRYVHENEGRQRKLFGE